MLNLTPRYTSTRIDELPAALQPLAAQSLTLARLYAGRGITRPDELETQLSRYCQPKCCMVSPKQCVY
ncbi:hypothetical protein [Psychrobacter sp. WY6]|uniref:hypothetical protein n=1 Tax=Psychrobacter sp. WY6 TaxID=2708350 RepID=UPI0032E7FAAD